MAPELRQREFDSAPPPHYPPLPPVGPSAQSLLIPESISFDPEDAATLRERLAEIQALGFHIEPFGGDTFLVEAIPAWMNDISAEPVIRNLARSMESGAGKPATSKELRDAMARSCCRMAAEMRGKFKPEELQKLVRDLEKCRMPYTTPYGRPTLIHMGFRELRRKFGLL